MLAKIAWGMDVCSQALKRRTQFGVGQHAFLDLSRFQQVCAGNLSQSRLEMFHMQDQRESDRSYLNAGFPLSCPCTRNLSCAGYIFGTF